MIDGFLHKGLERFAKTGNPKGVKPAHLPRLRVILQALTRARTPFDLQDVSLHSIARSRGNRHGFYSLKVNANWRVTFRYDSKTRAMCEIDYVDYH